MKKLVSMLLFACVALTFVSIMGCPNEVVPPAPSVQEPPEAPPADTPAADPETPAPPSEDVPRPAEFDELAAMDVSSVSAAVLQGGSSIHLAWSVDSRSGGTYRVYRSLYPDFHVFTKAASDLSVNYWDDAAADDTPCFYYIGYHAGTAEYLMDGSPVMGLRASGTSDLLEPNDTVTLAQPLANDGSADSVLYAVTDSGDAWHCDCDWYYVEVPVAQSAANATYTVSVKFAGSVVPCANVHFQFSCRDVAGTVQAFPTSNQSFTYSDFDNMNEATRLYFRVYATSEGLAAPNKYENYTISVSNAL